MKKILFLMLIMGVFSPLINAYEYEFLFRNHTNVGKYYFINDSVIKIMRKYGSDFQDTQYVSYISNQNLYSIFNSIKNSPYSYDQVVNNEWGNKYIGRNYFNNLYKSDLIFLNDLLTINNNAFLNYLYNNSSFNDSNYINYNDYELLYDSDGLAVESIVNGVWAGLYDDDQKQNSGKLYNASGELVYKNGVPSSELESIFNIFDSIFLGSVRSAFYSFGDSINLALFVMAFLVLGGVLLILNLLVNFLSGSRRRGWGSSRSESVPMGDKVDYGIEDSPEVIKARSQAIAGIKQKMRRNGLI